MLRPGYIPDKEPLLRVGIILPEDEYRTVRMIIPPTNIYLVDSLSGNDQVLTAGAYTAEFREGKIAGIAPEPSDRIRIRPQKRVPLSAESGIWTENVIAGRGFHWQKRIPVYLPGTVEIAGHGEHLILINEVPLEDYLMCVATSEMSSACPPALIESQTIVARSWMLANIEQKHVDLGMDVCNDDCCQRYQGTAHLSRQSVSGSQETRGLVLMHEENICDARYSKSCGGIMERFSTIWNGSDLPYLQNRADAPSGYKDHPVPLSTEEEVRAWIDDVPDAYCGTQTIAEKELPRYLGNVDEQGSYFRWTVRHEQQSITDFLNRTLGLDASHILALGINGRGGSGRIRQLAIRYGDRNGKAGEHILNGDVAIRRAMHPGFLYSSCFYVESMPDGANIPSEFVLHGAGWGHGVGLCQIGALGMSLQQHTAPQILSHYYPGSELRRIYS